MHTDGKEIKTQQLFTIILSKQRRKQFLRTITWFSAVTILIMFVPFIVIHKFWDKEYDAVVFFFLSEFILIFIALDYFKKAKFYYSLNYSQIYQCLNSPEKVTKISIDAAKIKFEIEGIHYESIYLKDVIRRNEIIRLISILFGNEKIVKKIM